MCLTDTVITHELFHAYTKITYQTCGCGGSTVTVDHQSFRSEKKETPIMDQVQSQQERNLSAVDTTVTGADISVY